MTYNGLDGTLAVDLPSDDDWAVAIFCNGEPALRVRLEVPDHGRVCWVGERLGDRSEAGEETWSAAGDFEHGGQASDGVSKRLTLLPLSF